jgi:hypothetical protein
MMDAGGPEPGITAAGRGRRTYPPRALDAEDASLLWCDNCGTLPPAGRGDKRKPNEGGGAGPQREDFDRISKHFGRTHTSVYSKLQMVVCPCGFHLSSGSGFPGGACPGSLSSIVLKYQGSKGVVCPKFRGKVFLWRNCINNNAYR